jgi:adenylosuccinate lyase
MRNLGQAFSFSLQSYKSFDKALNRIAVNEDALRKELDQHYELLAEPV